MRRYKSYKAPRWQPRRLRRGFEKNFGTDAPEPEDSLSTGGNYYRQCGEQQGAGATAHEIVLCGRRVIVDWGLSFEVNPKTRKKAEFGPACNFFRGQRVDMIISTHPHLDHVGYLVPLINAHPEAQVYISADGLRAAKMVWNETVNIALKNMQFQSAGEAAEDLVFNKEDAFRAAERKLNVVHRPWWSRPWPGWKIGFYPSGHDAGAMSYCIVPPEGPVIYGTGDVASHDQNLVTWRYSDEQGKQVEFHGVLLPPPEWFVQDGVPGREIVLLTEATKGADVPKASWPEIAADFVAAVRQVAARGGQLLLPAFKKNRSASLTRILVEAGIVPHLVPSIRRVFRVDLPEAEQWSREGKVVFLEGKSEDIIAHARLVMAGLDTCGHKFSPIIATAAMMDNGFSPVFAKTILPRPENAIFSTGHVFPCTVMEDLLAGAKKVRLNAGGPNGVTVPVRCEVRKFGFTSHDYQPALAERAWRLNPCLVIAHHCADRAYDGLAAAIRAMFAVRGENPPEIVRGSHMKEVRLP